MNKKNIFEILKKSDYYKVSYTNFEEIVNGEFVKKLRKKLDMSQNVFATVLGITKKTIEKERHANVPLLDFVEREGENGKLFLAVSDSFRFRHRLR